MIYADLKTAFQSARPEINYIFGAFSSVLRNRMIITGIKGKILTRSGMMPGFYLYFL